MGEREEERLLEKMNERRKERDSISEEEVRKGLKKMKSRSSVIGVKWLWKMFSLPLKDRKSS